MVVFLNGKFVTAAKAVVSVNDRSFMFGDGLFETLRLHHGKPFRMAQHLERMVRGADFLKIKLPYTPKEIQAFAVELAAKKRKVRCDPAGATVARAGGAGLFPERRGHADARDDVASRAAAGSGESAPVESRHFVVPDSGERFAGLVQDHKQARAGHGPCGGGSEGRGRGADH